MLDPLFLPIAIDLHRSENSSLLQVQEFLFAKSYYVSLLSLFLFVFNIGSEYCKAELKSTLSFLLFLLDLILIIALSELRLQFDGLLLESTGGSLLRLNLYEVIRHPFS